MRILTHQPAGRILRNGCDPSTRIRQPDSATARHCRQRDYTRPVHGRRSPQCTIKAQKPCGVRNKDACTAIVRAAVYQKIFIFLTLRLSTIDLHSSLFSAKTSEARHARRVILGREAGRRWSRKVDSYPCVSRMSVMGFRNPNCPPRFRSSEEAGSDWRDGACWRRAPGTFNLIQE
jgi:hypothetical protein